MPLAGGRVAQLGERLPRTEEAESSNLFPSTIRLAVSCAHRSLMVFDRESYQFTITAKISESNGALSERSESKGPFVLSFAARSWQAATRRGFANPRLTSESNPTVLTSPCPPSIPSPGCA